MHYEIELTALVRYTPYLIPITKKVLKFLQGLNRVLRHPLVTLRIQEFFELVEWTRLIEIDLAAPTSRYEIRIEDHVCKIDQIKILQELVIECTSTILY
ncbi:hypothetical protein IEQ34_009588 [Dendrobium chrysotoxum]|uniref:Uncharacterized protein n=1 Tax=Dendrobium chrysotoxum TaxID=161865 RepID=A0AAV7H1Z8_DENCH|nr:hypothetical protein IEQ34_009588 [Dendrobium chrysotoxum]